MVIVHQTNTVSMNTDHLLSDCWSSIVDMTACLPWCPDASWWWMSLWGLLNTAYVQADAMHDMLLHLMGWVCIILAVNEICSSHLQAIACIAACVSGDTFWVCSGYMAPIVPLALLLALCLLLVIWLATISLFVAIIAFIIAIIIAPVTEAFLLMKYAALCKRARLAIRVHMPQACQDQATKEDALLDFFLFMNSLSTTSSDQRTACMSGMCHFGTWQVASLANSQP